MSDTTTEGQSSDSSRIKSIEKKLDELIKALQGDELHGTRGLASIVNELNEKVRKPITGLMDRVETIEESVSGWKGFIKGSWQTICLIVFIGYTIVKDFIIKKP